MDAGRNVLQDQKRRFEQIRRAQLVAALNLALYGAIMTAELLIAAKAHSQALLADGLNNLTGVASTLILLWGMQLARRPYDRSHRSGHWRFQTVATLISALVMYLVAFQALVDGAQGLLLWLAGQAHAPAKSALWVSLIAGSCMSLLSLVSRYRARQLHNQVLKAAAQDSFADAATSFATLLAILGARIGWLWLDGAAAIGVGLLIIKTATAIAKDAIFQLTDGFEPGQAAAYAQTISDVTGILKVRYVEARHVGDAVVLTVGIDVAPQMPVAAAYQIGEEVEARLMAEYDILDADVKAYPANAS